MSADMLREAAALMRSRAKAATPGPWVVKRTSPDMPPYVAHEGWWAIASRCEQGDAEHIAGMHPDVALAMADWLDDEADMHDWEYDTAHALTVARAYLGRPA